MYQPRTYRNWVKNADLVTFHVMVEETDCQISTSVPLLSKARKFILKYRSILKRYIGSHPTFLTTLDPYSPETNAPQLVAAMCASGAQAGVGPMAAVAGAIAQFAGEELLKYSPEVIIENGGDIYLHSTKDRLIGIYAGKSPLSGKVGIELPGRAVGYGISTSSGTVGHSLSFGKADAVVVLAETATLSDAVATALGNMIISSADISAGLEKGRRIEGVRGLIIIKDEEMGVWGEVKLRQTNFAGEG